METVPVAPTSAPRRAFPWLALLLAVAFLVRAAWLAAVPTQPVTDFHWYFMRAVGIAAGQGYQVDGTPTAYWPVGYPAFLGLFFAFFGPSVLLGKLLNLGLVIAGIALSAWIARELTGSERVAVVVAAILAFHPAWIAYSGILASEPLYTALSLLGVLWIVRRPGDLRWMAAAGVVFGGAVLVRPQGLLIPVVALGLAWLMAGTVRPRFRLLPALAVLYGALAVMLVPWTARNFDVFDQFVFVSTNGGDNLLIGNHMGATGRYKNPEPLREPPVAATETGRDAAARAQAIAFIREHPYVTIVGWPDKLANTFLASTDAPYWAFQRTFGKLGVPGMGDDKAFYLSYRRYAAIFGLALLVLASLGAVYAMVARGVPARVRAALPLVMVGYAALLSIVFFGNPRFAYPVLPFMAMLAAWPLATRPASLEPAPEVTESRTT